jgi:hypothetical protein
LHPTVYVIFLGIVEAIDLNFVIDLQSDSPCSDSIAVDPFDYNR